MQQVRSEKEESLRLRKIASSIAKEVKHFWDSIQKVCHPTFVRTSGVTDLGEKTVSWLYCYFPHVLEV